MQRALFLFDQLSGLRVTPFAINSSDKIIPIEKMVEEYFKLLLSKMVFIKKYEI